MMHVDDTIDDVFAKDNKIWKTQEHLQLRAKFL